MEALPKKRLADIAHACTVARSRDRPEVERQSVYGMEAQAFFIP